MEEAYFVYIVTDGAHTVLYTGVTSNLRHRVSEHRENLVGDRIKPYHLTKLVFFEPFSDVHAALERVRAIKGASRKQKISLITAMNPRWDDLSVELL
jgi:putative endonuclease